jgi:hypothetical protein
MMDSGEKDRGRWEGADLQCSNEEVVGLQEWVEGQYGLVSKVLGMKSWLPRYITVDPQEGVHHTTCLTL